MNARTIWKYPLKVTARQTIDIPEDSIPLSVQLQGDDLCLWVLVDPTMRNEKCQIEIYGTGHRVDLVTDDGSLARPDGTLAHLGTVQQLGGSLIWHVFERRKH